MLRIAAAADTAWIEEQYRRAGFIPSDLTRDTVIIAEVEGARAGLGRLVPAGSNAYELGGMFVDDRFRGGGVARSIVRELIARAAGRIVYCIPFADLQAFYASCGFEPAAHESAPKAVQEKLAWCERELDRPVLLMRLRQ